MSLYDELVQFQILPNSFIEWTDYRHAITNHIIQKTARNSSIAMFGAGRCHDIDLAQMVDHFSSITLLDENLLSMQEALHTYGLLDHPSIHISQSDFTGITPVDYRALADELSAIYSISGIDTDIHILSEHAISKLDMLYQRSATSFLNYGEKTFDYSMAFGVHSQINNMAAWIFSVFAANLKQSDPSVEKRMINANAVIIPRLNDAILKATRSAAFFGCEIENASISGSIQGACQCIDDLRKRGIVTEQAVTYWPFDVAQHKIYQMLIQQVDCTRL